MPMSQVQEMLLATHLYGIGVDRLLADEPNGFVNELSDSSRSEQFPEFVVFARDWLAEAVAVRDHTQSLADGGRKAYRDLVLRTIYGLVGDDLEAAYFALSIAEKAKLEMGVTERALGFLAREGLVRSSEDALTVYSITHEGLKLMEAVEEQERRQASSPLPALGAGVFIGHGRSPLYHQVASFVRENFGVEIHTFGSHYLAGGQIVPTLQELLDSVGFAIIVATAEDETKGEGFQARQNVVHETGLFQGRLGFDRVAILMQKGIRTYTSLSGLIYVPFDDDHISQTFLELGKALRRVGYKER